MQTSIMPRKESPVNTNTPHAQRMKLAADGDPNQSFKMRAIGFHIIITQFVFNLHHCLVEFMAPKRPLKENNISDIDNMSPAIHQVAEPPTFAITTVMKYNIPKETEFNHAYEVVVALELENKNIKFSVNPNLVGDLILSPQDHNTAKILSEVTNLNGKTVKIIPLDPEEKTTKMVQLRYLLELPVEVIIKHPKVTKAERCVTIQDKSQTKQVLDKIEDTGTKSIHAGNHDKSVNSTTAVPELYKSKSTKHHIAWDTATPQATTHLNTPQPANLQAAFKEEHIKQMITIMIVTVSTIIRKQDTNTKNIIIAVMTRLTEKMQDDQTPKTPQLQVKQTTPLSQISDKKKNLPHERSFKTVKPEAPCNRSRGIQQQAQTVPKNQPPMSTPFLTDEEESDSTMNAESNYNTSDEEIMIE
ncbi:putative RNA-directed DNA polymerase from mobile element jockey-like 68 [Homarus americanus]|uniref:Putative RNA-directed DNA polymerase from mobile element jockey-like 68 n=1 Tax=Homarus americanus TaxID=6706 RepID=A0A8J5NGL0_HOMAM|nr:putative RNA-directed DNA polymerase from mobile element jockey-like 68 [Homarus americanus]